MDKLDLTSSRVLKGSMKFTPKIGGKKDKLKKTKKVTKSTNPEGHKKIIKKNVTKKPTSEVPINSSNVITIDIDTDKIASKIVEQENISKHNETVNTKSITVNTISHKNNNESVVATSIKAKAPQSKDVSKTTKTTNESQTIKNVENKKAGNVIIENHKKDILAKSKATESKNKKEARKSIVDIEEDTISEISDDFLRSSTMELNDSIEDSQTDMELLKKTSVKNNSKDNEETLIEEAENSDNSSKELSSELADETLIIEDSQKILETDEEEINKFSKKNSDNKSKSEVTGDHVEVIIDEIKSKKSNNKTKNQSIKKLFTDMMNKNKESSKQNEVSEDESTNDKSIYELLEQEEFNQSIDTEIYNKPINNEDEEVQQIVKEKTAPKRKVGRPPKKPRGRKPAKKQVELIVISDAENSDDDDDDETLSLAQKKTLIKKELEKNLPAKIKQEGEGSQLIPVSSLKRSNFTIEIEEQERPIRQIKRAKVTKKANKNSNNDEGSNENEMVEQENVSQEVIGEKESASNVEKEKAKNAKAAKAKTSKVQKATKISKPTKTNKAATETEADAESESGDAAGQKKKANNKKRKAPSPTKKTNKKKKVNGEEGHHGSSDGEESDNISISSRTIADIIDNYRGTEISTTQKEIYRLAALKRKATLDRKRGRLSTPEITTQTVPEKPKDDKTEKKPKVYDPEKNKTAIQMRVVNGEIVIDQQSTLIDHIDTTDEALPMLKYDENNHITSASFKPKLKPLKWSKEETELFYKCLSIFGTNFSMLAIMFPSRNRKQLLNKYKNEEKVNPGHVQYALKHKMALDPEFFEKYSGQNMMEIGREAVEEVRLIEEQRKKEDMELFNLKKKENNTDIKRVIIKNEKIYFCG